MFLGHFRSNFTVENKVFDFLVCVYVCVIYITDFFLISACKSSILRQRDEQAFNSDWIYSPGVQQPSRATVSSFNGISSHLYDHCVWKSWHDPVNQDWLTSPDSNVFFSSVTCPLLSSVILLSLPLKCS